MSDISHHLIGQIKTAVCEGEALNIVGRNSKQFYGRTPDGAAIEVAEHRGIVNYQPGELVLTARSGTPLSEIQSALDEHRQMLSFEPPGFGAEASIGGTLACNQSGPSRPWSGSVRDMVLGVRLINGKGQHLRFGGQVMKNVAGYDVSRFLAGSLGCLGLITEVTLKILPKPAASTTLSTGFDSAQSAIAAMNRLCARPVPVTGCCWIRGTLFVRLQGSSSAVDQASRRFQLDFPGAQILDTGPSFWSLLREQQLDFFSGSATLWRFSVASNLGALLPKADWLIDWGGAQRWLRGDNYDLKQLNALLPEGCGEACAFRSPNRTTDVFPDISEPLKTIYRNLKRSFDPASLFNPGRMYSWL